MDTNQTMKWTILTDVSKAMQDLTALHEKIIAIQNAKAGIGSSKVIDDAPMKNFANSYSRVISDMTKQAEDFYRSWKKNGNIADFANYKALIPQIQQLTKEQELFNKSLKNTGGFLQTLGTTFSKHLGWAFTGLGVGSAIAGAIASVRDIARLETEFNQLKTVLPELEENQHTYNAAIKDSFALAEKYGTKIEQVTESLRLMGRGYHELSESEKLAEIALKLGVADSFDPQTATRAIEAVVGAYGKQGEAVTFATKVMDSMTAVSHTAQVSASDLAEALLRSAAAAKTVGVGFDELNSLIAVISRNTGLNGETVGQGIKSILNSIHSDKAIADLQSIGVEVYKIGNDGQKEFRKISDVLLDVSIKAKATNQNFEELFRNLAGGKFQITKLAALIGDPNEYLRVLGNSINSSGFTGKQIAIQMDTIQRKAQTLKASFEELLTTGGSNSGFTNSLKSILDTLNQIIKGLNNVNPLVWNTVGGITKLALAFVALRTAVNFATASYALLRSTIVSTTAAQGALNVATVANPWGALAKLIVLAGTALATYAYFAGGAAAAQEKANQAAENAITAKQSQIEMTKQQTSYMETLGNTYVSLQEALAKVGADETKAAEIKKTMGTVTQQLTQIVGQEKAERILASEDIMGAITQEQAVHNEKTKQMQQELDNLRVTQVQLANDTVAMCNERISAINAEAEAFDKAADAIGQALGRIAKSQYYYYNWKGNYLRDQAGKLQNAFDSQGYTGGYISGTGGHLSVNWDTVQNLNDASTQAFADRDEIAQNAIGYYAEQGRVALGKLYTPGSYNTTPYSTGSIPGETPKGSNGNGGSRPAPDRQNQIEKIWSNHEVNHMLSESKISADKYQEALAKLQVQQDLTGETAELDAQKFQLMTGRTADLAKETDALTKKRDEFQQKAADLVAGNSEMESALNEKKQTWAGLTREEQKEFIHAYLQQTADEKLGINYLDMADKLDVKIADNNKTVTSINNDVARGKKSSPANIYSSNMRNLDYDEQLATYALGRNATDEEKRMVQLNSSVLKLAEAERRLQEIKAGDHTTEELKQQQVVVEGLKEKVLELKDTWKQFGEEAYEALDKIIIQGESISKVFGDLWKQMASAALKSLITGKPVESSGLLSGILKLFGHNAEGSIGNQEELSWIREGNKREAIIPLEDNKERGKALWLQSGKELGMLGAPVEPYLKNPGVAQQATYNVQIQQNQDHIDAVEKTNELLTRQNQMLLSMVNSDSDKGNVIVLPMAPSAESVMGILRDNPEALYNILNRHSSNGYR